MYTYYDQYVNHAGDADAQDRWARQLTWEVARHAVGEELVVYPLMEKHLGAEGKKLADEDRADHQVKCLTYEHFSDVLTRGNEFSVHRKSKSFYTSSRGTPPGRRNTRGFSKLSSSTCGRTMTARSRRICRYS